MQTASESNLQGSWEECTSAPGSLNTIQHQSCCRALVGHEMDVMWPGNIVMDINQVVNGIIWSQYIYVESM